MDTTKQNRGANGNQGAKWCRRSTRLALYLRGGMACAWCGAAAEDGASLTLDHLETGHADHRPTNLVVACLRCNSARADRPVPVFAAAVAGYLNHGVSAEQVEAGVAEQAARDLTPYRAEARAILARRPAWQDALSAAMGR